MTVGVLITNYQAWPLTAQAIAEVLRWSGNGIASIVVVDDASDAPSQYGESDKVLIHHNENNLGYVRSVNVGMALLTTDIVLFLDCDAYPLMDLVPGIIKHFSDDPQLGALGFLDLGVAGRTRIAGEPEPTLAHFLLGQALGGWLAERGWFLGKRFVLHSCCMAVRRSAFQQTGGFDEAFDFLDADTDFSMRLQDAGWKIGADSNLKCFHQGSGSPQTTARRVSRYHRNRWLLLTKHRRVRAIAVCRMTLVFRHMIEWALLQTASCASTRSRDERREKSAGRKTLLRTALHDYEVR